MPRQLFLPTLLILGFMAGALAISIPALITDTTTIAIIGCHKQERPAPALSYFAEKMRPEITLWVGDNVYADTKDDAQHIMRQLRMLEGKEGFRQLRENSIFMVTWDDHDYGLNDAGRKYRLKEESKAIHREFWGLEKEVPADRDGVYYSRILEVGKGRKLQIIMLDGRFNRDDPGPKADALGENQWKWLESELRKKADLRLVVSGYQVLIPKSSRWESWAKLGDSKQRLFDLIKRTEAKGVVFITGDQHYVEVLREPGVLGYDAYEIMAAGVNQTEEPSREANRVSPVALAVNTAPVLTIQWENSRTEVPHLLLTVTDVDTDKIELTYRINFSEIGL